jgi:hypothetical protein
MKTLKEIQDGELDAACHQAASSLASNANNEGVKGQIDFLRTVCGWSEEEILNATEEI